jgi:hypothetical protein
MPGLVPAIYVFRCCRQDVDGRDEPGHDVERFCLIAANGNFSGD